MGSSQASAPTARVGPRTPSTQAFISRAGAGTPVPLARIREKTGTGVCNCRHLADAHEILFQTIYATKRGRCTVSGCSCQAYVRNPNYHVVSA